MQRSVYRKLLIIDNVCRSISAIIREGDKKKFNHKESYMPESTSIVTSPTPRNDFPRVRPGDGGRIDREALVRRHNPAIRKADALEPLSVGNGEFYFTADITGLQTFPEFHSKGIPLCILSNWIGASGARP
jgi:hypothetical protein